MTLIILLIDPRISMWIPMAAFLYWVVALRTPGIQGKPWRNGWAAGVVAGVLFGLMLRQYMDY